MDKNNDHLTVYYNDPVQSIPLESKDVFVALINAGEKPSNALKSITEKYRLDKLDHSITLALLRAAYPNADLMDEGLKSRIIDADYPNHKTDLTDQELDEIIERINKVSKTG